MPVKMGVDPESTKAPKPVPADWYELRIKSLTAKPSKSGAGINYNLICTVINSKPDYNDKPVYGKVHNGPYAGYALFDFCHAVGLPMEADGTWPGGMQAWVFDPKDPDNVSKAQYKGPMLGKTLHAEVAVTSWEGNDSNQVKQIRCKIPDCAVKYPDHKHRLDLIGKSKT